MNSFKTGLLMSLMTGLFLVVGALVGGSGGMMFAFVLALGLNLFAYWNSDKMLLRMGGGALLAVANKRSIELVRFTNARQHMFARAEFQSAASRRRETRTPNPSDGGHQTDGSGIARPVVSPIQSRYGASIYPSLPALTNRRR